MVSIIVKVAPPERRRAAVTLYEIPVVVGITISWSQG